MFTRTTIFCSMICSIGASGATFFVSPPFTADCSNGFASVALTWSGASGPVQIRVGKSSGPAMTGFTDPSGSAVTGAWVTDGMTFYLMNMANTVEAEATARVHCGGTVNTIDTGLTGGSYFPLAVGNTWVYKDNNRFTTATYVVRSITGTQLIGTETYYVLTQTVPQPTPPATGLIALLRADNNGVIYQNTSTGDQIYLNPGNPNYIYSGPLGTYRNALQVNTSQGELMTALVYVRGLGLVNSQTFINAGSDGGFAESLDLVDVRVDGIHLSLPTPKITLAIENTDLDLTNKLAPNCPVPCYYVACGIGGGPSDPPTFYRPCAQIRIDTASNAGAYTVLTELLNSGNMPVFKNTMQIGTTANNLAYLQVPLYTSQYPNSSSVTMLPAGDYILSGTILSGTTTLATSTIAVHIH